MATTYKGDDLINYMKKLGPGLEGADPESQWLIESGVNGAQHRLHLTLGEGKPSALDVAAALQSAEIKANGAGEGAGGSVWINAADFGTLSPANFGVAKAYVSALTASGAPSESKPGNKPASKVSPGR